MIKVGLTGGIGSGKTTVAKMFKEHDIPLFIADVEAKLILDRPDVVTLVANTFNLKLNSESLIHKPDLASIVFNDEDELEKLNSIIHPRVYKRFQNWLQYQESPYIIYEAAIIFEKGRASDFDYTILVSAPEDMRIQRVMQRDHTDYKSVKKRMKAQWPESKKRKLADFVVENINLNETRQQVKQLHEKFLNFSDK